MTESLITCTAGDLELALARRGPGGLDLQRLVDRRAGCDLAIPGSLFTVILKRVVEGCRAPGDELALDSSAGWNEVAVQAVPGGGLSLAWAHPAQGPQGLRVEAQVQPDAENHALRWQLHASAPGKGWALWRVVFPQAVFHKPGEAPVLLLPSLSGLLHRTAWDTDFHRRLFYPNGWMTPVQFTALYGERGGLYWGIHDPLGSTHEMAIDSDPQAQTLRLALDHPVPGMGLVETEYRLPGEVVWRLLRGDWFDAALIYKNWARQHARWFPQGSPDGRADTPLWLRELSVWVNGEVKTRDGRITPESLAPLKALQQFFGVPLGYHWYNWHQIPFDNDYPHYFPPKEGFGEAVRDLQAANIYVMPYINGRLWDTRDRGVEDFEFSRVARPAATEDENGEPYIETYGSKEADGSPVRLAVMCPATPLWQDRVQRIVLRLIHEYGVDGVYIDQVAAEGPKLCLNPAHGHPLGGGAWWNEGYWQMLDALRAALPPGRMLTTECNAEVYARWFDAYLTWTWTQEGMVPAFPAIYGGQIQLFGRAYGGKPPAEAPTHAVAWRMMAAQQLAFGEQIGWFSLDALAHPGRPLEFLRRVVRLRHHLRRYFYAGEMGRPPQVTGNIPMLSADWQWTNFGRPWVSEPALFRGAWRLPEEKRLALVFANAAAEAYTVDLQVDLAAYGLSAGQWSLRRLEAPGGPDEPVQASAPQAAAPIFSQKLAIAPEAVFALEFSPA